MTQGGRQAPHTFLPPPRPARPPRPPAAAGAQLEQKPGRKASAEAAVDRASQRLNSQAGTALPTGRGPGHTLRPLLCPRPGPSSAPCPLGLRFPLAEGRAWTCSQLLPPSPQLWQRWSVASAPICQTPSLVAPVTPLGQEASNRAGVAQGPTCGGDGAGGGGHRLPGRRALLQGRGLVWGPRPWRPLEHPHFGAAGLRDTRRHPGVWEDLAVTAGWGGTGPQSRLGK